jgi:hypothetical protein
MKSFNFRSLMFVILLSQLASCLVPEAEIKVQFASGVENESLLSSSLIDVSSVAVESGSSISVLLTAKETAKKRLTGGGLNVVFFLQGGTSSGTFSSVTDHLDGTYSAVFTGVTAGSATKVSASINGSVVTSTRPSVTVNFGTPIKLVFGQQPSDTQSGSIISPNVTVRALDINNNLVSNFSTDISIAIDQNPVGGTLSGTLTRSAVSGVGSFNDLAINLSGIGYQLLATSGGLAPAVSSMFNISSTAVTYDWLFTSSADYTFDSGKLEFSGGVVRLPEVIQTDSAATEATHGSFSAGSSSGVVFGTLADGVNQGLKLGSSGGCTGATSDCAKQTASEIYQLNSSWTPHWGNVVAYWDFNNSWNERITNTPGNVTGPEQPSFTSVAKIGSHSAQFVGTLNRCCGPATNGSQVSYGDFNASDFGTADFTIATWVKSSISDKWMGIVSKNTTCGNHASQFNFQIAATGIIHFNVEEDAAGTNLANLFSTISVTDGNWHHVVATRAGAQLKIYIDGQQNASLTGPGVANINSTDVLSIGWHRCEQSGFNGNLDEMAIWSGKALSLLEVLAIYERQKNNYSGTFLSRKINATSSQDWTTLKWLSTLPFGKELPDAACSPDPTCPHTNSENSSSYSSLVGSTGSTLDNDLMSGIVGLWHLNEPAGTTGAGNIKDSSGKGFHGNATGATLGVPARFGTGASIYSDSERINLGPSINMQITNGELTFSSWLYRTSNSNGRPYGNYDGGGFQPGDFDLRVQHFLMIEIGHDSGGGTGYQCTHWGTNLPLNQWSHVVVVYSETQGMIRLYYNGNELTGTTDCTIYLGPTKLLNSGLDFLIGGTPVVGDNWKGLIDEYAIWNRALHADEIKQLYQRGASRLKFQIRTCDDSDCLGEDWQGPDGTVESYFSELNNNSHPLLLTGEIKKSPPSLIFSDFLNPVGNNQYFQYRAILEADHAIAALMPELKSVTVDPIHFEASSPVIYANNGVELSEINTFTESLGAAGCVGGIGYNLSLDKINWKYWNGANWVTANDTVLESNTEAEIIAQMGSFTSEVGRGTVYVKAYLKSSGTAACELENIHIEGIR